MNSDLLDQGTSVGRRGLLSALFFASAFFCHPCFGLVVKVETIGSFENPQNSKRVLVAEKNARMRHSSVSTDRTADPTYLANLLFNGPTRE
jgi:hypothetical protein